MKSDGSPDRPRQWRTKTQTQTQMHSKKLLQKKRPHLTEEDEEGLTDEENEKKKVREEPPRLPKGRDFIHR